MTKVEIPKMTNVEIPKLANVETPKMTKVEIPRILLDTDEREFLLHAEERVPRCYM